MRLNFHSKMQYHTGIVRGLNMKKIGLLGGDMRQIRLASLLAEEGYETAVWGFRKIMDDESMKTRLTKCVRCADWESAVRGSDVVLLPLPVSADGVRLNCPLSAVDYPIRLTEIVEKCGSGALLLGGRIPSLIGRLASERGIGVYDYYENEALQIKNAVPTAEGAIEIAIRELPVTLKGCTAVVTGYGRVGRCLAVKLRLLGAKVYAAARSSRDRANAETDLCIPLELEEYRRYPVDADIVFNTVPSMVFDREVQGRMKKDTLIVELASNNSGVELRANSGIRVIDAQGLPGKLSPFTAGEIIYDAVREILKQEYGVQ